MIFSNAMDETLLRRILVVMLALAQLILPQILFFKGFEIQSQMPPQSPELNPATPAGYAFSIWAVIYLGALAYAVYQVLPSQASNALLQKIGWLTAGGYVLCCAWLVAARFGPVWLTVPIIMGMLLFLGSAFLIATRWPEPISAMERNVVICGLVDSGGFCQPR
jgi:hypothetical protein